MSYLYDGLTPHENLQIPPMKIFVENKYRMYRPFQICKDSLKEIVTLNSFSRIEKENDDKVSLSTALFAFKSFINHSRKNNVKCEYIKSNLVCLFASENIQEGQELFIDYCQEDHLPQREESVNYMNDIETYDYYTSVKSGSDDSAKRNQILEKYCIYE